MAAIYPNKWRAAMGDSPHNAEGKLSVYGDTWAKGLTGLTPEELTRLDRLWREGTERWAKLTREGGERPDLTVR